MRLFNNMKNLFENWRKYLKEYAGGVDPVPSKRKIPWDLLAKGKIRPGAVWAPAKETEVTKRHGVVAGPEAATELAAAGYGDLGLEEARAALLAFADLQRRLMSKPGMQARALSSLKQRFTRAGFSRPTRLRVQDMLATIDKMPPAAKTTARVGSFLTLIAEVLSILDDYTTLGNNNELVANYNRQELLGDYRVLTNTMISVLNDISR